MTVVLPPPPTGSRLARLRELRHQLDVEIAAEEAAWERACLRSGATKLRPRSVIPACGTDSKYHWHRYHEPDNWPLPKDDPCGCRAAHRRHEREMQIQREAARAAARRPGARVALLRSAS